MKKCTATVIEKDGRMPLGPRRKRSVDLQVFCDSLCLARRGAGATIRHRHIQRHQEEHDAERKEDKKTTTRFNLIFYSQSSSVRRRT